MLHVPGQLLRLDLLFFIPITSLNQRPINATSGLERQPDRYIALDFAPLSQKDMIMEV